MARCSTIGRDKLIFVITKFYFSCGRVVIILILYWYVTTDLDPGPNIRKNFDLKLISLKNIWIPISIFETPPQFKLFPPLSVNSVMIILIQFENIKVNNGSFVCCLDQIYHSSIHFVHFEKTLPKRCHYHKWTLPLVIQFPITSFLLQEVLFTYHGVN